MKRTFIAPLILIGLMACPSILWGQYFGRNKARYKTFDFKETLTPHFKIYHYLENDSLLNRFSMEAERWYSYHVQIFGDSIKYRNPIVLYNNHADFQQTNVISGLIGVGTGGVTEGLRNRVVMPLTETNSQRDHVLGHELVHAFQYNMIKTDTSLSFKDLQNVPLWMVEGLAEYLSLGKNDSHTAMWMRDAVASNDIPTIKDLNYNTKYFPYRYGQAFWAFIAGAFGDTIVQPMFEVTTRNGLENACDSLFKIDTDSLSGIWKNFLVRHYSPYRKNTETQGNKALLNKDNASEVNIAPSLSPNGKYLAYLSRKNVFLMELYIADAKTGETIKKLGSLTRNSHVDEISSLESSGTWSPDGKQFAFVVFRKGHNELAIIDTKKKKVKKYVRMPGVDYINNPAWSPNGKEIVFTGLDNGYSDLYLYHIENQNLKQLTKDKYSNIQPNWSPDGSKIIFSTDKISITRNKKGMFTHNLALYDVESGKTQNFDFFQDAENLNPQFTNTGKSVIFLSNRDGFRNMYELNLETYKLYRLTKYFTGISGITQFSPAISTCKENDMVVYTYFTNGDYEIYSKNLAQFSKEEIAPNNVDLSASSLAFINNENLAWVKENLDELNEDIKHYEVDSLKKIPYKARLGLTYIGNTSIGISASSFGNGLMGGASMLFGDILQNHQLFAGLALNGEIYDFGGQVAYLNQKRRLQWGIGISHIPYRSGRLFYQQKEIELNDKTILVDDYILELIRVFEDQVSVFSYLPISTKLRFEMGGSVSRYSFKRELQHNYFVGNLNIGGEKEKLDVPPGYNLYNINAAVVGDNSFMGIASPMLGTRYRLQGERTFGRLNYFSIVADFRKYFYIKPLTIAWRAYHYSRLGADAENNIMVPVNLGYPGLVHGYNNVYYNEPRQGLLSDGITVNDILGSKIIVSNLELRLPFTGPKIISLIKSGIFFTEIAWFLDGGIAWNNGESLALYQDNKNSRFPVFSTGASVRINFFGQLIIEPYYAYPLNRTDLKNGWTFGINFMPGW